MTGEKVLNIADDLRNGIILCKLANRIKHGIIPKINMKSQTMLEIENIKMYLVAMTTLGVPKTDLFSPYDLYDKKFLPGVMQHLFAIGRILANRSTWHGPRLEGTYSIEPSWIKNAPPPSQFSIEEFFKPITVQLSLSIEDTCKYIDILRLEKIKTIDHLLVIIANRDSWNSLNLPSNVKTAIETHLKAFKKKMRLKRSFMMPLIIVILSAGLIGTIGYRLYTRKPVIPVISTYVLELITNKFKAINFHK